MQGIYEQTSSHHVFENSTGVSLTIQDVLERTAEHSLRQRSIQLVPTESRQQINRELGLFDPAAFVRSQFDAQNLQTKQENNSVAYGLKRNHKFGGTLEFNETLGVQDNVGALPVPDQGVAALNLVYSQEVLRDGGRVVSLSKGLIASYRYDESFANSVEQSNELFEKVIQTYWQLYRARASFFIQRSLTFASWELLQHIEERSQITERSISSLEQARALYLDARAELIDSMTKVQQTQDSLFRLINDPSIDPLHHEILTSDRLAVVQAQLDPWSEIMQAFEFRPEIAARIAAIQQNSVETQVSLNQLLPKLTLSLKSSLNGFENNRDYFAALRSLDQLPPSATASANMEMYVLNRSAKARNKEAQLRGSRLVLEYEDELQKVREEVLLSLRTINNAPDKIGFRNETLATREREVAALVEKIWLSPDEGVPIVSQLEQLFQAINRLVRTQLQTVDSNIELQVALIALQKAKGTLVQPVIIPANLAVPVGGPIQNIRQMLEEREPHLQQIKARVVREPVR